MSQAAVTVDATAALLSVSRAQRIYILVVLTLVGTFNFLDRQILSILMEPMRKELSFNDTELGFLVGIGFTAVQVILGIPVARIADNWSRRKVITIAVGIWSVMTALCGMAMNYTHMLLARIGVAVGQSGGSPPCQAFVADLYPLNQRSTAMGVYLLCVPAGVGLGMLMGGWAVGEFGWRNTFVLAALPGLILAPLVFFTLPERRKPTATQAKLASPPFLPTVAKLLAIPSFRNLLIASATHTFLSLGITAWFPSFLARSHGLNPKAIGLSLALSYAIPYGIGSVTGGRMTDVLTRRDLRWYFWIPTTTCLVGGGLLVGAFTLPTAYVFWFLAANSFVTAAFSGPSVVVAQSLAPISYRATVHALMLLFVVMVGLGLGPQAAGIVSDLLHPRFGEESLRVTLLLSAALSIPSAFFYFLASRTYRADKAAADGFNNAPA
jgi:MFS family permease